MTQIIDIQIELREEDIQILKEGGSITISPANTKEPEKWAPERGNYYVAGNGRISSHLSSHGMEDVHTFPKKRHAEEASLRIRQNNIIANFANNYDPDFNIANVNKCCEIAYNCDDAKQLDYNYLSAGEYTIGTVVMSQQTAITLTKKVNNGEIDFPFE